MSRRTTARRRSCRRSSPLPPSPGRTATGRCRRAPAPARRSRRTRPSTCVPSSATSGALPAGDRRQVLLVRGLVGHRRHPHVDPRVSALEVRTTPTPVPLGPAHPDVERHRSVLAPSARADQQRQHKTEQKERTTSRGHTRRASISDTPLAFNFLPRRSGPHERGSNPRPPRAATPNASPADSSDDSKPSATPSPSRPAPPPPDRISHQLGGLDAPAAIRRAVADRRRRGAHRQAPRQPCKRRLQLDSPRRGPARHAARCGAAVGPRRTDRGSGSSAIGPEPSGGSRQH